MSSIFAGEPYNSATIQKMLDENTQLIKAVIDHQNQGELKKCAQYQQILHRNLVFLATVADSNMNVQSNMQSSTAQPLQQQSNMPGGINNGVGFRGQSMQPGMPAAMQMQNMAGNSPNMAGSNPNMASNMPNMQNPLSNMQGNVPNMQGGLAGMGNNLQNIANMQTTMSNIQKGMQMQNSLQSMQVGMQNMPNGMQQNMANSMQNVPGNMSNVQSSMPSMGSSMPNMGNGMQNMPNMAVSMSGGMAMQGNDMMVSMQQGMPNMTVSSQNDMTSSMMMHQRQGLQNAPGMSFGGSMQPNQGGF